VGVHSYLWMSEFAHNGGGFLAYCAIAKGSALGTNGDDSYVFSHVTSFTIV